MVPVPRGGPGLPKKLRPDASSAGTDMSSGQPANKCCANGRLRREAQSPLPALAIHRHHRHYDSEGFAMPTSAMTRSRVLGLFLALLGMLAFVFIHPASAASTALSADAESGILAGFGAAANASATSAAAY